MDLMGQIGDLRKKVRLWRKGPLVPLSDMFVRFQQILEDNNTAMKMIADMEDKVGGEYVFDRQYLLDTITSASKTWFCTVRSISIISAITSTLRSMA